MELSMNKWILGFFIFGVGYFAGVQVQMAREKNYSMCRSAQIAWAAIENDYEKSRSYAEFKMKTDPNYIMKRPDEEQAYVDGVFEMRDKCNF